jgi:hypothetical protein
MTTMQTPTVYATVDAMLAEATDRVPVRSSDAKSGSSFEQLRIRGEHYFLKSLSHDEDWIMRVTGDLDHRPLLSWRAGLYHETPDCIDHTLVAMAIEGSGTGARLSMLMHDVGDHLIPEGDEVIALDTHESFIDHMAAMHAHFWSWRDTVGLTPLAHRFRFFAPDNIADELRRPDVSSALSVAAEGWRVLPDRAPKLATIAATIHADPHPLAHALSATPSTFIAGDWKMGNLGRHPDGRTILLDWAYPGEAPGGWDLAWYLALNRARLPQSKEDTIAAYRAALARRGVDTEGWFDRQTALSLLGISACFAWEKALGDDDELQWWADRAEHGMRQLTDER